MQQIVELVSHLDKSMVVAFLVGILTSEGSRRLAALALRAWGASLVAKAKKTPSKDDDKLAEIADTAADAVADALERKPPAGK